MPAAPKIVAVLGSDIHSSHTAPIARCTEDWYAAMSRPFAQVRALCVKHKCPFIIPGDLGHRWQYPPELINFLIREYRAMPHGVYAIPGQHDLAFHNYADIQRTAYWTLCEAGAIVNLTPGHRHLIHGVNYYAVPWHHDVKHPGAAATVKIHGDAQRPVDPISVALVHAYIWTDGCGYPGAPPSSNLDAWEDRLKGFNAAFFGDNHKGFRASAGKCKVVNCGAFIRRNADELYYQPNVYLLRADGQIKPLPLDCSLDQISADHLLDDATATDLSEFVNSLRAAESNLMDYPQTVRQYIQANSVDKPVADLLLESLDVSTR